MDGLPGGKIPPPVLRRLLDRLAVGDALDLGPAPGEDAGAAPPDVPDGGRLVMAADPVTFPCARPGRHAVIVNANDVAATGGAPKWFLSSVLAPPGTGEAEISAIFADIGAACGEVGAVAASGHVEVTDSVRRPVVAGAMVGVAAAGGLKPTGGARPGDMLVVVGSAAVEATAILAEEYADEARREFGEAFRARCAAFVDDPGISIVAAARAAAGVAGVSAMHDVTEGGVATAIREMAEASRVGVAVADAEIPRFWETKRLCRLLGVEVLGAIGSGALLVACGEDGTKALLGRLDEAGTPGFVVGRFVRESEGLRLLRNAGRTPFPEFAVDEVARLRADRSRAPEAGAA